jgi:hypothetical protein
MPRQFKPASEGRGTDTRNPARHVAATLGAKALGAVRSALWSRLLTPAPPKLEPLEGISSWGAFRRSSACLGRWVALDNVRYEAGQVVDATVLDLDADLAALCARLQRDDGAICEIVYCDPNTGRGRRPAQG